MRSEGKSILFRKVFFSLAGVFLISAEAPFAAPLDLTGYWEPLITEDYKLRMHGVKKGDYNGIALTDAAKAIADRYRPDAGAEELLLDKCVPHGAVRILFTDTRLHITGNPARVTTRHMIHVKTLKRETDGFEYSSEAR